MHPVSITIIIINLTNKTIFESYTILECIHLFLKNILLLSGVSYVTTNERASFFFGTHTHLFLSMLTLKSKLFKISSYVSHIKKVIQLWNDTTVSEWWQNYQKIWQKIFKGPNRWILCLYSNICTFNLWNTWCKHFLPDEKVWGIHFHYIYIIKSEGNTFLIW